MSVPVTRSGSVARRPVHLSATVANRLEGRAADGQLDAVLAALDALHARHGLLSEEFGQL